MPRAHIGAAALRGDDEALGFELLKRMPNGAARQPVRANQFVLSRQPQTRAKFPRQDTRPKQLQELAVFGKDSLGELRLIHPGDRQKII